MRAHIGISVRDLEGAAEFFSMFGYAETFRRYREEPFLGEVVGHDGAVATIVYLEDLHDLPIGRPVIELLQYATPMLGAVVRSPVAPGVGHLCLPVQDLGPCLSLCRRNNRKIIGQTTIPDGPNAGAQIAYVEGPDGFVVEMVEGAS